MTNLPLSRDDKDTRSAGSRAACTTLLLLLLSAMQACAQSDTDEEAFERARRTDAVTVVSLTQDLETPESRDPGCLAWKISRDDVTFFFAHGERLTPEGMHGYDAYPCTYSGWLSVNGRDYEFGINAAGFGGIRLTQPGTIVFYGCKRECERVFGEPTEQQPADGTTQVRAGGRDHLH